MRASEARIIAVIKEAEKKSSGEIRFWMQQHKKMETSFRDGKFLTV